MVASLGPFVISPHLLKNVPYDAGQDFDLLMVAVQAPNVLVVPAASPYKTVADLVTGLKRAPDKVTFASSGQRLVRPSDGRAVLAADRNDGRVHVPYKGGAPAITDLLGGQVDASFQNINAIVSHVAAGKLRALAVTGAKRSPLLPQVPTLAEAGVKDVDVYSWQGVAAPKGLPADVKAKLHAAMVAALDDPGTKARLTDVGFEIVADTPEHFAAFQRNESARWKQLIESRRISAD